MVLHSPYPLPPSISTFKPNTRFSSNPITPFSKPTTLELLNCTAKQGQQPSVSSPARVESNDGLRETVPHDYYPCGPPGFCCCGRRRLIGAIGTTLVSIPPSKAAASPSDPTVSILSFYDNQVSGQTYMYLISTPSLYN